MQYRNADGKANVRILRSCTTQRWCPNSFALAQNFLFEKLGQAGEPYAKSVPSVTAVQGARPDPGDLFDCMSYMLPADLIPCFVCSHKCSVDGPPGHRQENNEQTRYLADATLPCYDHHSRLESSTWIQTAFQLTDVGALYLSDIFRSNKDDKNISDTSSYLDLTPLYGRNLETQLTVRTMENGLLKPDSFAEERLLHQPPGVCIYLIMYSRFHNYVAQQLLTINENGKFSLPPHPVFDAMSAEEQKQAKAKLDEDLFQTARLYVAQDPFRIPSSCIYGVSS